jgi:hypothetical protein
MRTAVLWVDGKTGKCSGFVTAFWVRGSGAAPVPKPGTEAEAREVDFMSFLLDWKIVSAAPSAQSGRDLIVLEERSS